MKDVNKFIDKSDYNTLKRSYMDACSNKDFYNYVSNLPIEEDTLIKYTSTLEESFKEFENCKNCKSLSNCKNKIKGYKFVPEKTNNNITFSYTACERKIKQDEKNKYLENIKYYDISTDLSKASFKDVYKDDKNEIVKDYSEFDNLVANIKDMLGSVQNIPHIDLLNATQDNIDSIRRIMDECKYSMRTLSWIKEDLLEEKGEEDA